MSLEKNNLETHVELCELRYRQLDQRIERVEQQLDRVALDLRDVRTDLQQHFDDLRDSILAAKDQRFTVAVSAASTVIVALIGLIGYIALGLQ